MMGGRGSMANLTTVGIKYGARMSPEQYKSAVHDKANFVFRELNADDAIQIILKRSFRAGVPVLEVSSDGINLIVQRGLKGSTISSLRQWKDRYEGDKKQLLKDMRKDGGTWSSYDEQRAERQVKIQAIGTLKEAIEELKKKR